MTSMEIMLDAIPAGPWMAPVLFENYAGKQCFKVSAQKVA